MIYYLYYLFYIYINQILCYFHLSIVYDLGINENIDKSKNKLHIEVT